MILKDSLHNERSGFGCMSGANKVRKLRGRFFFFFIDLFIFGCVGSSFLCEGFL